MARWPESRQGRLKSREVVRRPSKHFSGATIGKGHIRSFSDWRFPAKTVKGHGMKSRRRRSVLVKRRYRGRRFCPRRSGVTEIWGFWLAAGCLVNGGKSPARPQKAKERSSEANRRVRRGSWVRGPCRRSNARGRLSAGLGKRQRRRLEQYSDLPITVRCERAGFQQKQ